MPRPTLVPLAVPPDGAAALLQTALRAEPDAAGAYVVPCDAPTGEVELRATVAARPGGSVVTLTTTTDFAVPYFRWFVGPLTAWLLRRARRHAARQLEAAATGAPLPSPRSLLAPPVRFTSAQAGYVAAAGFAAAVANFGSALFGQQAEYVREAFDVSKSEIGTSLAITRVGVLVALGAAALSDRRGRRRLLLLAVAGVAIANAVSALAPNIAVFTVAQLFTRGCINAVVPIAAIAVVEEAPEGARAFSLSMLALAMGAGYAVSVALLPLSDLGPEAWRLSFAASALTVAFLPRLARRLRETHRYQALERRHAPRGRIGEVFDRRYGRRFLLLAVAAFVANLFSAPASQLTNTYLADDRGFSATGIAVFRAITNGIPGLVGLVIGGRLAESRGRKPVAITASLVVGALEGVFFLTAGPTLWLVSTIAIVGAGIAGPALAAFGTELFPTEVRGTSNAFLLVAGLLGSIAGLLLVTNLADPLGSLGNALALAAIAPMLVAVLVLPRLPEAAHRRLDDVSPSEV